MPTVFAAATTLPRCILVIAPRHMIGDELRLARLEAFLEGTFPDLNFVVSDDRRAAGERSAAGVMPQRSGRPAFPPDEGEAAVRRVLAAVNAFVDYGARLH